MCDRRATGFQDEILSAKDGAFGARNQHIAVTSLNGYREEFHHPAFLTAIIIQIINIRKMANAGSTPIIHEAPSQKAVQV